MAPHCDGAPGRGVTNGRTSTRWPVVRPNMALSSINDSVWPLVRFTRRLGPTGLPLVSANPNSAAHEPLAGAAAVRRKLSGFKSTTVRRLVREVGGKMRLEYTTIPLEPSVKLARKATDP